MLSVSAIFPAEFRTDVLVTRPAEKDNAGRITSPATTFSVEDCLVDQGTSGDRPDLSSLAAITCTLYAPKGTVLKSTDKVTVPASHPMKGTYSIDGRPYSGPLGVSVTLTAG